jgi:hypothetical protein
MENTDKANTKFIEFPKTILVGSILQNDASKQDMHAKSMSLQR